MKKLPINFIFLMFLPIVVNAQQTLVDWTHVSTLNTNEAAREGALATHQSFTSSIKDNLSTININITSVVAAQDLIYKSLSNVNSALKNGLAVKNMAFLINDMIKYSDAMVALAKEDPILLLFAESYVNQIKTRGLAIVNETANFVLNEGDNVLMDFEKRDKLMQDLTQQLRIMDGLAYSAWSAMFWTKQKGIFKALNPWQNYINQDKAMVSNIIANIKYLKQ